MSWFSDLFSGGVDTSVQSTQAPDWAVPYLQNYLQTSQNLAGMPYTPYGGQTVAGMNPLETQGLNAQAQRAAYGSPVMNAASGELQKTLSGGYLNNNPYLDGVIGLANRDVMTSLAPVEARSGSFGNSGVQYARDRALADSAMGIRANDYSQERNRMVAGVGQAPGIANQDYIDAQAMQQAGQRFQQQDQANLTDQYQRFQEAQAYPYKQFDVLGKGVGLNFGQNTTLQTPGTSPMATGVGTAATLYPLMKGTTSPTVICTELHRQGRMSDEMFNLDQAFGDRMAATDPAVLAGYYQLAMPVVRLMRRSSIASAVVSVIAKPWAKEMAHQMGVGKGSLIGKLIMAVGIPLCRSVGQSPVLRGV